MPSPSETNAVEVANLAYYQALSARDMRAMQKVWTCAADNILIAPPVKPATHVGWDAIRRQWEAYWPTFEEFNVAMQPTAINIIGPVAWVHGIETSRRRSTSGLPSGGTNLGTNIFARQDDGRWLMVFHQAAAMP